MPILNYNPNDYQEPTVVPAGRYDLIIAAAEYKLSKKERPMFQVRLDIDGHDEAAPVFTYITIPQPGDAQIIGLNFRRFMELFKIKVPDPFDTDVLAAEMPGHRANVELVQEEFEGNPSNKIVLPKLEANSTAGRAKPPGQRKTA